MRVKVRQAAALAAAGVLSVIPAASSAQEIHPGEQRGLGLTGPEVPDLLKTVAADPYKAPAEPACETIPAEILALDKVLGADADDTQAKKSYMAGYARRSAAGAIRGMVPYRGAIRFLTGADHKDRQLMDAARAGWARRGFLRGLEANLHCAPETRVADAAPEQPPPETADVTVANLQATKLPATYASTPHLDLPPAEPVQSDDAPQSDDTLGQVDLGAVLLGGPPADGLDRPGR